MQISKINAINISNQQSNKQPSFGIDLVLSKNASKYIAQDIINNVNSNTSCMDNDVKIFFIMKFAKQVADSIDNFTDLLRGIKPVDYPITMDLTEKCEKFFIKNGKIKKSTKYDEFELCPRGIRLPEGSSNKVTFSMDLIKIDEYFKNLPDIITNKIENGWWV